MEKMNHSESGIARPQVTVLERSDNGITLQVIYDSRTSILKAETPDPRTALSRIFPAELTAVIVGDRKDTDEDTAKIMEILSSKNSGARKRATGRAALSL